jgi:IgGFc binding protein
LIDSTLPVQLISGHYCADIPDGVAACDHLEESMFPVDTLGTKYVINAPAVTSIPAGKAEVVRVIATGDLTNLTFDPPVAGAPAMLAHAGDFVEIPSNAQSYQITADQKVLVAQYMEGQDAGGNTGDPAMTLAVPTEQFRSFYLFHAPTSYESNYVDVTAPMGATVSLDGMPPLTFTPIGGSGFGLARVQALGTGPANDGNHSIQGDMAFGITVYGYGQYTSYWYPGGLNLDTIIE